MSLSALWVSPTAPFPVTAGNRQHLFQSVQSARTEGFEIDFVLYATESDLSNVDQPPPGIFSSFSTYVQPVHKTRSHTGHWGIDDWVSDEFMSFLSAFVAGRSWDVVFVEYVWMSRVVEALSPTTVVIINTHDVFSNRDRIFTEIGVKPSWFFTRESEEARGLARADFVLAISDADRFFFQKILGSVDNSTRVLRRKPRLGLGSRPRATLATHRPLTLGYVASANQLNKYSISTFLKALSGVSPSDSDYHINVVGSIGAHLPTFDNIKISRLGFVPDLADFYAACDLVIAPMVEGTGAIIKAIEAVDFGMPLIATKHATNGMPIRSCWHSFDGPASMADALSDWYHSSSPSDRLQTLRSLRYESTRIRDRLLRDQDDDDRTMWRDIQSLCEERKSQLIGARVAKLPHPAAIGSSSSSVAVSVIVAAHNTSLFIKDCLNSIISDKLADIEVILVDDGSTDDTAALAEEFAARDRRVTVVSQENQGPGPARNRGMRLAKGNYLYFVDSDDQIGPDSLFHMHEMSVLTDLDICSPNRPYLRSRPLTHVSSLPGWCCFVRREVVFRSPVPILQPPIKSGQDGIFSNMVLTRCSRAGVCDAADYHYTKRDDSTFALSQADFTRAPRLVESHIRYLRDYYLENGLMETQGVRYLLFLQDETFRLRFRNTLSTKHHNEARAIYLSIKMELMTLRYIVAGVKTDYFTEDFWKIADLTFDEYVELLQ